MAYSSRLPVRQLCSPSDFVSGFLAKVPSHTRHGDVQRRLEQLADACCWKAYPRCSRIFTAILGLTNGPVVADMVLQFLMELCASIVWQNLRGVDGLFELLVSFCQQLSSFSSLESWKACVLMLMAMASYSPGDARRWEQLEPFNPQLQSERIVLYKDAILKDVPASCVSLVCIGIASKLCQDLEKNSLSMRLIDAFKVSEDLMSSFRCEGSMDHLEKFLQLTNMALEKCEINELVGDDYILVSRLMIGLVDVMEEEERLPNDVYSMVGALVGRIPMELPFHCSIKLLKLVIEAKPHSPEMAYLLMMARICVTDRWPEGSIIHNNRTQDVLQELLAYLFRLTLSDVRAAVSVERRLLETVVNLYLAALRMEAKDETVLHSGGLSDGPAREKWLLPLASKLDELTVGEEEGRLALSVRTAKRLVSYACKANADPAHVVNNGLPLL